ncbi:MAG TPA: ABC transporter substrate-binding protein [Roseiflexaceae bacterium]|nr:ABC transporter substrate-binding protein [Roseiflexaceae bacterium]
MNRESLRARAVLPLLAALVLPILAACGGGAPAPAAPIRETVVVTAEPQVVRETVVVEQTVVAEGPTAEPAAAAEAFTTPHPILSDVRVRQAIAYCTNRPELIKSVYGFLNEEQQQKLLMDANLPQGHWALAPRETLTVYDFDPAKGNALLDEAGWTQSEPGAVRTNAEGMPLSLEFTTTNAGFRVTWATVLEQQLLENCGIQIIRKHAPASWWFGDTTGLARRDFEIGAFAWVGEADPTAYTLYACNQIPTPQNGWEGQNYMGWCNETASKAILAGDNSLDREERKKQYAIFQQEFTKDMVSLPLFNRLEGLAANKNLQNFKPNSTEYVTANAHEWVMADGSDSIVMGFTQEPASLFTLVEDAAVARMVSQLITALPATTYDYDYQPFALKTLPTIDNGGATLTEVEVKEGDKVWTTAGEAADLAPGVEVRTSAGEVVTYESGTLKMNQLAVTFEYQDGLKWEDGEPFKQADFELGLKIDCDKESGATSFTVCESRQNVEFQGDLKHTVTYLPGALWPEYSIYTITAYPSHQKLSDGRVLADVPAKEWATLPEIAEDPLSSGPYMVESWEKGQRMVLRANPNFFKGEPAIKEITIQFVADTNQAVAQLLTGDIDIIDQTTLGAGPELETVLKEAEAGKIQAVTIASPTWEHMDFNLFVK